MIKNLENKMQKMQESINKDLGELKNKHAETNNTITEIKSILEGINSRIPEAEEWISELEDKMVEITYEEQNKVKKNEKSWGQSQRPLLLLLSCFSRVQLCATNPIDGSPPGSPVPGILQARILEWVASSFSNAWKWKVKVKLLSRVLLLAAPWTVAYQAPASMEFSTQEYWSGLPFPSPGYFPDPGIEHRSLAL